MPEKCTVRNVIGSALSKCRGAKDWSQATLAAKCQLVGWDISRGVIAAIEGRSRVVQDWELLILSRVLKVSTEDLLPKRIDLKKFPIPSEKTQEARRSEWAQ